MSGDANPLIDLAEDTSSFAVALYYADVHVEVSPEEVRFRNPAGIDVDPSEIITSFSRDAFDTIVMAHQAVPRL